MAKTLEINSQSEWTSTEKLVFKFFGIYFFLQVLPIDIRFFKHLFSINWLNIGYPDIFYLSKYAPSFTGNDNFANWLIIAVIAGIGTFLWDKIYKKDINYDQLYYWIRVVVRYRLAIGVIAYGFLKFFPIQSPIPSISNLNTEYGDFTAWKLFSLGLGVVPNYQSFLGLIEIVGGLLLLNRKTTTIATLIILPFAGNVAISNIAYEGGEYVYAFYLIALALYLFAFDAIRLFNLLSLEKPTLPNRFQPVFDKKWSQVRLVIKFAYVLFFVIFYGLKTYGGYQKGGYHFPAEKGLENTAGLYNVSEFKWNNQSIPYSKTDTIRWQNVVFEKWNTISIKSNKSVILTHLPSEEIFKEDASRVYELSGSQGRHYYQYSIDPSKSTLSLSNKNVNHQSDQFTLSFKKLNDSTLVLSGVNTQHDSVYAVLNKVNKKYLTFEAQKLGRRGVLKL